jgi:hypothetical protein
VYQNIKYKNNHIKQFDNNQNIKNIFIRERKRKRGIEEINYFWKYFLITFDDI